MHLPKIIATIALAILTLTACVGDTHEQKELFVTMLMTKAQQASSIPTDSGVLLRDRESGEWKRFGPTIQMISSAAADPTDPNIIFLACGNGIVRTKDGGKTWRMVSGWRESDVLQIAIDPEDNQRVYAASAWGVTISEDGGDNWEASNEGLPEYFSKNIIIDHRNTSRLVVATGTGLFESRNRAKSWKRIRSFPESAGLRLRRSETNQDLWICGSEGQGLWLSTDDAKSWKPVAPALKDANVYGVAIDPFDENRLAAGGWGTGVHISDDQGKTWRQAASSLKSDNITSVIYDANIPHRLWASTFEEGSYYTDDGGQSWTSANLDGAYVQDIWFLPASRKHQ